MSKERIIMFGKSVDKDSVRDVIEKILEVNRVDDEKEEKEVGYTRTPIKLTVNSFGGSVYNAFALMAVILTSKTPVHTYCYGYAMSAGLSIFLAGHKRFAHPLTTFMYHSISSKFEGTLEDIAEDIEQTRKMQVKNDDFVLKQTNILKEKLDAVKNAKSDWYIDADEAKKLGIIHELIQ